MKITEQLKELFFGKGQKPSRESETYRYGTDINTGRPVVTIMSGKYKTISLFYGKVTIPDEPPAKGEKLRFSFEYNVTDNPTDLNLTDNREFINVIGAILSNIIWYEIEDPKKGLVEAMVPLLQGTYKKQPKSVVKSK